MHVKAAGKWNTRTEVTHPCRNVCVRIKRRWHFIEGCGGLHTVGSVFRLNRCFYKNINTNKYQSPAVTNNTAELALPNYPRYRVTFLQDMEKGFFFLTKQSSLCFP